MGPSDVRGQRVIFWDLRKKVPKRLYPQSRWLRSVCVWFPDQNPERVGDLFEAYVRKVAPRTVDVSVTRMHTGKPWMTDFANPFVQAAGRAI